MRLSEADVQELTTRAYEHGYKEGRLGGFPCPPRDIAEYAVLVESWRDGYEKGVFDRKHKEDSPQ